jgi:hypothetical protein
MSPRQIVRSRRWQSAAEPIASGRSVRTLIDGLMRPVSPEAAAALEPAIVAEGELVAEDCRHARFAALQRAEAAHRIAQGGLDDVERRRAGVEAAQASAPGADVLKALVVAAAGAICFAAEFAITWETLPFLLNVPKHSRGGVALGLTVPIIATTVLHLVLERLFEAPWQARLSASCPTWHRRAATFSMWALLAVLGAGTLYTIYVLGVDRGEALRAQVAMSQMINGAGDLDAPSVHPVTTRAFVAIGVLLAVAGAVAFLVAGAEIRLAVTRARLAWQRLAVRRRLRAATHEASIAAAALEASRRAWEHSGEYGSRIAERHVAGLRMDLNEACRPPARPRRKSLEAVDALLSGGDA